MARLLLALRLERARPAGWCWVPCPCCRERTLQLPLAAADARPLLDHRFGCDCGANYRVVGYPPLEPGAGAPARVALYGGRAKLGTHEVPWRPLEVGASMRAGDGVPPLPRSTA